MSPVCLSLFKQPQFPLHICQVACSALLCSALHIYPRLSSCIIQTCFSVCRPASAFPLNCEFLILWWSTLSGNLDTDLCLWPLLFWKLFGCCVLWKSDCALLGLRCWIVVIGLMLSYPCSPLICVLCVVLVPRLSLSLSSPFVLLPPEGCQHRVPPSWKAPSLCFYFKTPSTLFMYHLHHYLLTLYSLNLLLLTCWCSAYLLGPK